MRSRERDRGSRTASSRSECGNVAAGVGRIALSSKATWVVAGVAAVCAITAARVGFEDERAAAPEAASPSNIESSSGAAQRFAQIPLHFEPTAAAGTYVSRGAGYALELEPTGARLHLAREGGYAALDLDLIGAQVGAAQPEGTLPGVSHYFVGQDPSRWRTRVPHFQRVRYASVYPGIDLLYYGSGRELEYDFIVAPGADPARIQLTYAGAQDVRIDERGDLRIAVGGGDVIHRKPVVYQVLANGVRAGVKSAFRIVRHGADAAAAIVSFDLGTYDVTLPLVIDPVLTYATYLGGGDDDRITTLQVDAAGAVYVGGSTLANDFPVTGGSVDTTLNGGFDAFVAKLNPQGTALEYATYLGGSSFDEAMALRVDGAGAAYVMGMTSSNNFPTTAGAPQTAFGGAEDAFVAKLNATGATLLYSTYIGGSNQESAGDGGGFEIDAGGNAYVYSATASMNFPTTAGAPQTTRGNPNGAQFDTDAFLTKINAVGTAFAFSTYHGGGSIDAPDGVPSYEARQLSVDASGSAWIVGTTESTDFPTTAGAFDTTFNGPSGGNPGGGDMFVARFDTVAGTRSYSTFIGGSADEFSGPLAVDATGNAYVAMRTGSADFPTTAGAFDAAYNGGTLDLAVAKLNPTGSALIYSTYLGGDNVEQALAIRIDAAGNAFLGGDTASANFPSNGGADTTHNGGPNDGFITKINAAGNGLAYSTFVGSSDTDGVFLLEIDSAGSAYALLNDTVGNAPVTTGGRAYVGNADDYFVKVSVSGAAFLDGSYIGGGDDEGALAMAVDASQNLYLAGLTNSTNYPTTAGVVQPAKAGAASADDAFIVKFATTPDGATPQPGVIAFTSTTFSVNEAGGNALLTLGRSGGSDGAVSVTCTAGSSPGFTATPGVDYTAVSVTVSWANGDNANKTCSVPVTNDTDVEGNETFEAQLSNVTGGATIGTPAVTNVTITDDETSGSQPGVVQFGAATYSGNENGGSVTLTLTRTNGTDGAISVSVASGGGSASVGSDYTALTLTVNWAAGDGTEKTVNLAVLNDSSDEPNETVTVTLSNATSGATVGAVSSAEVTIVDDDPTPPAPGPAQNGNARGSYGGGSMAWWSVFALGALALASRAQRARSAASTATLMLCLLSVLQSKAEAADVADGWYLGLRGGVAESTLEERGIEQSLASRGHDVNASLDDRHRMAAVFGGYRWSKGFGLEGSLVDLGEYDIALTGTTSDPAALLADAEAVLADAGRGVSASVTWSWVLTDQLEVTPRFGAYYWKSDRELRSEAGNVRHEEDGVDVTGGVSLTWRLTSTWSLGLGWEVWDAGGRNDVRAYTAAVSYRFSR